MVNSDLSYFHNYDTARRIDAGTAAMIERGNWAAFGPNETCGYLAIAGLLVEAGRQDLKVSRLALCNSGDTAGPRNRVLGYGAWLLEDVHPSP